MVLTRASKENGHNSPRTARPPVAMKPRYKSPQQRRDVHDGPDLFEYDYMISVGNGGQLVSVESLPSELEMQRASPHLAPVDRTRQRSCSASDLVSEKPKPALSASISNPEHSKRLVRPPPEGVPSRSPVPKPKARRPTPPTPEKWPLPPRGPPDGREDFAPMSDDDIDDHIYVNLPSHRLPVAGDSSSSSDEL